MNSLRNQSRLWIDWEYDSINNNNNNNNHHNKNITNNENSSNNIVNILFRRQLSVHSIKNSKLYYDEIKIKNLQLSTYYEIQSGHDNCPAITLALEKQEDRYLLSGGADGVIVLYDLNSYEDNDNKLIKSKIIKSMNKKREHVRGVSSIQWYPEDSGIFISSSFDGKLLLWDTNVFTTAATFNFYSEGNDKLLKVYRSSMCSNGIPLIASALDDSTIRLCDPRSGDCCQSLKGHRKAVMSISWNPLNSHLLASASLDGTLKLWDIRKAGFSSAIRSFDWMQDHTAGTRVFTDVYNKNKNKEQKEVNHIRKEPIKGAMTGLDWTKDSVAKAHESGIMSLKFSPCGHYIISSGNDRKIRLWDADSGILVPSQYSSGCSSTLPYDIEIAQFSCSGDDVLIFPNGNDGDITLTQLHSSTGRPFLTLQGHLGMVQSLIYRSLHQQIISASTDGLIFIWDTDNDISTKLNNKYNNAKDTNKVFTNDDVEVASDWSSDENDDTNRSNYKKCFIPPIIQRYIDDARSSQNPITASASSNMNNNNNNNNNILDDVSARVRTLFPTAEVQSFSTTIIDDDEDDTVPNPKRLKSNFKKIYYRK